MRILFGLAAVTAAAVAATAASAEPSHLSDVAYIEAGRCVGIATSKSIASPDAKSMIAWFNAERRGREEFVVEKAEDAMRDAKTQADRANPYVKSQLEAELGGACATLKG
jgi:hypothetical protein